MGLLLLGWWYYDPDTERFLTRDPAGYSGGLNLYASAGNNPVNKCGSQRHQPDLCGAVGAGLGAIVGGGVAYVHHRQDVWQGIERGAVVGGVTGFFTCMGGPEVGGVLARVRQRRGGRGRGQYLRPGHCDCVWLAELLQTPDPIVPASQIAGADGADLGAVRAEAHAAAAEGAERAVAAEGGEDVQPAAGNRPAGCRPISARRPPSSRRPTSRFWNTVAGVIGTGGGRTDRCGRWGAGAGQRRG